MNEWIIINSEESTTTELLFLGCICLIRVITFNSILGEINSTSVIEIDVQSGRLLLNEYGKEKRVE